MDRVEIRSMVDRDTIKDDHRRKMHQTHKAAVIVSVQKTCFDPFGMTFHVMDAGGANG